LPLLCYIYIKDAKGGCFVIPAPCHRPEVGINDYLLIAIMRTDKLNQQNLFPDKNLAT